MTQHLIVRHPFGSYGRGDRITDPEEVTRVAQDYSAHVVPVSAPEPDPPHEP